MLQFMRPKRVRHDLATKRHQPVKVNLGKGLVNSKEGPTWWTGWGLFLYVCYQCYFLGCSGCVNMLGGR